MPNRTYSHIIDLENGLDIYVCSNCGAQASTPKKVKHYENCTPGESKCWAEYRPEPEEENTDV